MRSRFPATAAFIIALTAGVPALAQDDARFLQQVNDLYTGPDRAVPESRRSDLALIPALATFTAPPAGVDTPLRAALASPESGVWGQASAWASAPLQQALLGVLRTVGEPLGAGRNYAFLLPYGFDAVSVGAREAGMFVRVGEPPILAAAEFEYLDVLTRLSCLVHVEATRLAEDGRATDAATLLVRWTLFARQIANREFFVEQRWGVRHAVAGLERLRDIVHEYPDGFTGQQIADLVGSLKEDNLGTERLQLPRANLIAGEQILARAFVEREGPSERFGSTMARASAGDRPLRLFGEAARWQGAAAGHGTTFETGDALRGVFRDWEYRWRLPEFDRGRKTASDYDRLAKEKFAAVDLVAEGVQEMFDLRQRYRAEAEATRLSLGVMGYKLDNGVFPRSLSGVRPRYAPSVGPDPYSESRQDFHYFVPVRDQPRGERDLPKPHEISVGLPGEMADFASGNFNAADIADFESAVAFIREARERAGNVDAAKRQIDQAVASGAIPADRARAAKEQLNNFAELFALPGAKAIADVENPTSLSDEEKAQLFTGFKRDLDTMMKKLGGPSGGTLRIRVDDSSFVFYSAGADQNRDWAVLVGEGGRDILFWPPLLSIVRDAVPASSVGQIPLEWIWPTDSKPSP